MLTTEEKVSKCIGGAIAFISGVIVVRRIMHVVLDALDPFAQTTPMYAPPRQYPNYISPIQIPPTAAPLLGLD